MISVPALKAEEVEDFAGGVYAEAFVARALIQQLASKVRHMGRQQNAALIIAAGVFFGMFHQLFAQPLTFIIITDRDAQPWYAFVHIP